MENNKIKIIEIREGTFSTIRSTQKINEEIEAILNDMNNQGYKLLSTERIETYKGGTDKIILFFEKTSQ